MKERKQREKVRERSEKAFALGGIQTYDIRHTIRAFYRSACNNSCALHITFDLLISGLLAIQPGAKMSELS